MKNYCIDCKEIISNYHKRCWKCYVKYSQSPENNSNLRHGRYINNKTCIICKTKISRIAKKCNKCAGSDRSKLMKKITRTKSWIKKQAIAEKNKIISQETREKISLSLGGTGIPFENRDYSSNFYNLRKNIRQRDNYTCQICNKYGNNVHHIDYDKQNSIENNLITLCRKCHSKTNIIRDYWFAYFTYIMENYHV